MQKARYWLVASCLVTAGATMWTTGCGQFYDQCIVSGELCPSNRMPKDTPVCTGNPFETDETTGKLKAFSETCSVFVSSKASGGKGTKAEPFSSLSDAVSQANGKWVIACHDAPFDETVTTRGGVQVYGGFSCVNMDWKRDEANKAELAPTAPTPKESNIVTLTLQNRLPDLNDMVNDSKVIFQDFVIKAPDAVAPASSSIGVVVDTKVLAEFLNCDIAAGKGLPGASAQMPMVEPSMLAGVNASTTAAGACFMVQGGAGATKMCVEGTTVGGDGGDGGDVKVNNGNGQTGQDGDGADASNGKGGQGATATSDCTSGLNGKPGAPGADGEDGGFGNLTITGITGGDGTPGLDGERGHGGGGGGGSVHGAFCPLSGMFVDGPGASGGGGGSGGCAGKGGGAGKAGGSSIAIISLNPDLKLSEVTLTTGNGGPGGTGVAGTVSGAGGRGAAGGGLISGAGATAKPGCAGGDGGDGGPGGKGGSGRGGHSIGVVFSATPTTTPTLKMSMLGTAGIGGSMAPDSFGRAAECWDSSRSMTCSQ